MLKAIIFDFDGVIVESVQIKTEAFRKVFSIRPDRAEEGVSYHLENMGISRYSKFKYFYENILGEPYSESMGLEMGRVFSKIVLDEIKRAPLVKGTEDFLKEHYRRYKFFIASGTPQDELVYISTLKGIHGYFKGVFGTPSTKTEIVGDILSRYFLESEEIVFVGDAMSDKVAAEDTGVHFVARITDENESLNDEQWKVNDMTDLVFVLQKIDKVCKGGELWREQ